MKRTPEHIYDEWLVLRSQARDRDAFRELVERWNERIGRLVWRLTDGHADTADIVQDIWVTVLKKLHRLKDPACFPQWIYRITGARCADLIRKLQRERKLHQAVSDANMSEREVHPEDDQSGSMVRLKEAIHELPPERRLILSLFYIDELSTREIAKALGIPVGTVKSRLFAARENLRKIIERNKS